MFQRTYFYTNAHAHVFNMQRQMHMQWSRDADWKINGAMNSLLYISPFANHWHGCKWLKESSAHQTNSPTAAAAAGAATSNASRSLQASSCRGFRLMPHLKLPRQQHCVEPEQNIWARLVSIHHGVQSKVQQEIWKCLKLWGESSEYSCWSSSPPFKLPFGGRTYLFLDKPELKFGPTILALLVESDRKSATQSAHKSSDITSDVF